MSATTQSGKTRRKPIPARRHAKTPQQRAAEVTEVTQRLNEAVAELATSEAWTAMLRAAARFHRYSWRNVLLLHAQAADRDTVISQVAGFRTWKALGRNICTGEKAYKVLAPVTRRLSHDEAIKREQAGKRGFDTDGRPVLVVRGFKLENVFDIAQTDGDPLPESDQVSVLSGAAPDGLWAAVVSLIKAEGYTMVREPEPGDRQGWTNYPRRVVSVRPDVDDAQAAHVALHELAHIRADHLHRGRKIGRHQAETEAESVAYVVSVLSGLPCDNVAVPYIGGWSDGTAEIIEAASAVVQQVSHEIIGELEQLLSQHSQASAALDAGAPDELGASLRVRDVEVTR